MRAPAHGATRAPAATSAATAGPAITLPSRAEICVDLPRGGVRCVAGCTRDADCATDRGERCDPVWRGCLLPNTAAIVPATCPDPAAGARDPAFAAPVMLAAGDGYQVVSDAALAADGALLVAYTGSAPGLARFADGAAAVRSFPARDARAPVIAMRGDGELRAAWAAGDAILAASSRDDGATWLAPRVVHDPGDCDPALSPCVDAPLWVGDAIGYLAHGGVRLAGATVLVGDRAAAATGVDRRGRRVVHVVGLTGGEGGAYGAGDRAVVHAAVPALPRPVSRDGELLPRQLASPAIAVDARRGWLYIAYVRGGRDARWDLMLAASRDGGATWRRTRIGDDPACALHATPALAVDPASGTLHVAWLDTRGGGRFAHATCGAGATRCRERGRISDAPFAARSTGAGTPRSLGEHARLVIDPARRALHAVWTQPVATPAGPAARVFAARARL